jgi:hypothetical protein
MDTSLSERRARATVKLIIRYERMDQAIDLERERFSV